MSATCDCDDKNIRIINFEINANDIIVKNTATYAKNKLEEKDANEEIS